MLRTLALTLLLATVATTGFAQDVRYISDTQYVPLRSGAGNEFRIINRGLPSGTRLIVARISKDREWAEITTDKGTTGWLRAQYLMKEQPAQNRVVAAEQSAASLAEKNASLTAQVQQLQSEHSSLEETVTSTDSNLVTVTEELARLKQISGKAVQLDTDNRRLVVDSENLRSKVETLQAENQRLQDNLKNEAFIDGALAVLLGVIITLVVPRLWPKRRRSSSWA